MVDNNHKDGRKEQGEQPSAQPNPLDGLVAASVLGMAMAGQAMQIWFGVISGVARAGQEMLDQHNREAKDAPAPARAEAKPTEASPLSKSEPKHAPVSKTSAAEATVKAVAAGANVVPLKPVVKATAPKPAAEPAKPSAEAAKKTQAVNPAETVPANVAEALKRPVVKAKAKPASKQQSKPKAKGPVAKAVKALVNVDEPAAIVAAMAVAPVVPEKLAEAATVMPDDFRQPKAIDKPQTPDDLKQIPGVGPKLEKVLNGLGVWTFAQVAAWDRQETAWVDDYLGLNGRIARDGWAGQAQVLANGGKTTGLSEVDEAAQNAGGKNG